MTASGRFATVGGCVLRLPAPLQGGIGHHGQQKKREQEEADDGRVDAAVRKAQLKGGQAGCEGGMDEFACDIFYGMYAQRREEGHGLGEDR